MSAELNVHAPRDTGSNHSRFDLPTVDIEGFAFLNVSEARFVELVVDERKQGRGGWVITPNADILRQAHVDPALRALFSGADAVVADGMPIIWASRVQGTPLQHGRVCGSDLMLSIPAAFAAADLSIFLLGGVGNTGDRTAEILLARSPKLRIVGRYSPPFGFEKHPDLYEQMRAQISAAKPDIIFVAISVPKSERLIREIRASAPDAWWIGVGASFDFVSGAIPRAPRAMQRLGLEWLYRMLQDPKRLVRRYLRDDVPYLVGLLARSLRRRFGSKRPAPATVARKPRNSV